MSTSLSRSLKILEAVVQSDAPRGISELSRELDLDKSAVQRTFQALCEAGYIEKVAGTSRYRPTLRIWELGSKVIAHHEACRLVHPILRYGAKMSGLTAYFAWSQVPDIVYIDKVDGDKGRPNSSQPGRRVPMYRTAAGRAILAFLKDSEANQALLGMAAGEEGTESEQKVLELRKELALIRTRLFAVTRSGSFAQVNSIAAPVWSAHQGVPIGSIVLTSDAITLPEDDFNRIGHVAVSIAEQATRALGGTYPTSQLDTP